MKRPQRGKPQTSKNQVPAKVIPIRRAPEISNRKTKNLNPRAPRTNLKLNRESVARFTRGSRQKRVILFGLISSFVILVLVVLATLVTPILAVEKIKITGLHKVSQKSVLAAVRSNIGTPLALVDQHRIAEQLASFKLIESFSIVSELPHTLHIVISERQPIAIVDVAGASYLFDPAGIRLGAARSSDVLPRVLIDDDPKTSKTFGVAIDVLLALPANLLNRISVIDAKSKDDVRLVLRGYSSQSIIWGDSSQAALKSKVLAALIRNQKASDRVTFDVSSPTAPVVRYH